MATSSQAQQANDLYEDDFTKVTVARKNRRNNGFDSQKAITYLTLGVAVIAIIVGSVAISKSHNAEKENQQRQNRQNENLATTREAAELTTGASTMISTFPFCSESPQNRQACINLIAAGEKMLMDVANKSVSPSDMAKKVMDPSLTGYEADSKIEGISATTEEPGSHTAALGVVTDDNGHVLDSEGKPIVDKQGDIVESPLFDVDNCLFTYKNKLCLALVPVGKTAEEVKSRREAGQYNKFAIPRGQYIPVMHASMAGFVKEDGRLKRGRTTRSAAILGCLGGAGGGMKVGGPFGGAVGFFFDGAVKAGSMAGKIVGGGVGCAAGAAKAAGWWRR